MPKRTLRQAMLSRRASMTPAEVAAISASVEDNLLRLPVFADARTVAAYAPVRNEVGTERIIKQALALGKRVLLPAVEHENLIFREVSDPADMVPGRFGIPEPDQARPACAPEEADLIIVPGVAFDRAGKRLGYGKGFYDRSVHVLEGSGRLAGLCYEFQIVQEIPSEPHDVVLDYVVTEERVIITRSHSIKGR